MARPLVLVLVVLVACGGQAKPDPVKPAAGSAAPIAAAPTGPAWWCAGGSACAVERAKCEGDCKPFDSVSCHQAKAGGDASSRCFSSWQACDDDRRAAADANARTDCLRGGPPTPAMASASAASVADSKPPKGEGWWCFTTEPMNAECLRDKDHCTKDADDMRAYSSATTVSECTAFTKVWCHQFADDENAHPLCYPTPAYCENGRKIMSGGTGNGQTPCVTSN